MHHNNTGLCRSTALLSITSIFGTIFSSAEKLAEAQRRSATLQNELQSSLDAQRESNNPPGLRRRKTVFHRSQEERCKHHNIKDLKLAFSEFYLSLILLQNYQVSLLMHKLYKFYNEHKHLHVNK